MNAQNIDFFSMYSTFYLLFCQVKCSITPIRHSQISIMKNVNKTFKYNINKGKQRGLLCVTVCVTAEMYEFECVTVRYCKLFKEKI